MNLQGWLIMAILLTVLLSPLLISAGICIGIEVVEFCKKTNRNRHLRLREKYLALSEGMCNLPKWDPDQNDLFSKYKGAYEYHKQWLKENK